MEHTPRTGDDADLAAINTENDLNLALYRRKIDQHNSVLPVTGQCHFCEMALDDDQKFCPVDEEDDGFSCAKEYQRIKDAEKRNGKV